MSQHNAHNNSRNCWNSARERERLKARFEIRERVAMGQLVNDTTTNGVDDPETQQQLIKTFLRHVSDGSIASFSLSVLSKQTSLLTRPVPSSLLSDYKITTLCTSRFGRNHATKVLAFCQSARATCTMMEYAALLGEYKIIGALLLGGIDPTVSGDFIGDESQTAIHKDVPVRLQRRFFDCFPLSLSTYIVKRVVDMRFQGWIMNGVDGGRSDDLCFGEPCHHRFSEEHFWLDLLDQMDKRVTEDVVCCPVCGEGAPATNENDGQKKGDDFISATPQERCQESRNEYLALPIDSRELKARTKGKSPKKRIVSATWNQAVAQSLGNSKDVRQDKFFSFVERGSIHYVRGCLERGIDVNGLVNDYGQTALYLSAWKGRTNLVELLLWYGADPTIAANGGSTALAVAKANGCLEIVAILEGLGAINQIVPLFDDSDHDTIPPRSRLDILIPSGADHPGAGACNIDAALREDQLAALAKLQSRLPLALSDKKLKKKLTPCSNRHYYSDAHGWIRPLLEATIVRAMACQSTVTVLPHMRFLHYTHAGSILAPHVDLCRVNDDGRRSTHTFILYLESCENGGETVLLQNLTSTTDPLAIITPTRGRLLLFPHNCPHMGAEVIDLPKLLLRGEVILSSTN